MVELKIKEPNVLKKLTNNKEQITNLIPHRVKLAWHSWNLGESYSLGCWLENVRKL